MSASGRFLISKRSPSIDEHLELRLDATFDPKAVEFDCKVATNSKLVEKFTNTRMKKSTLSTNTGSSLACHPTLELFIFVTHFSLLHCEPQTRFIKIHFEFSFSFFSVQFCNIKNIKEAWNMCVDGQRTQLAEAL